MNLDEKKQLIILAAVCGVFFCIEVVVGWNLSSKNSETRLVLEQLEEAFANFEFIAALTTLQEIHHHLEQSP